MLRFFRDSVKKLLEDYAKLLSQTKIIPTQFWSSAGHPAITAPAVTNAAAIKVWRDAFYP
jgi:hypothetical protein